MPNEINSENWSIDSFSSGNLGNTNASNFRDFLFGKNLPDLPQFPSYSLPGNFGDYGRGDETNITTKSLEDPGNVENWVESGGYEVGVHEIRDINLLSNNKYGPSVIDAYNFPGLIPEETGFLQYKTSSGQDFRASLVGQQLGFGYAAGLKFDSQLVDVGKEQRKEEFKQRVKQNFLQDTVGKINADPLGLLTGQPLLRQDYTITKGTGLGGQALNALSDLTGVNIPISPIPEGAFGSYGTKDSAEELLDFTGGGTRSLIYDSLAINLYGPTLIEDNKPSDTESGSGISNAVKKTENFTKKVSSGEPATKKTYLDPTTPNTNEEQDGRESGAIKKVNDGVDGFIDGIANKNGVNKPLTPTESKKPTPLEDPTLEYKNIGFDSVETNYETEKSDENFGHIEDYVTDVGPKRGVTLDNNSFLTDMTTDADKWFWADSGLAVSFDPSNGLPNIKGKTKPNNGVRRGLLNHTQNMINQQINNPRGAARYIGLPNANKNYGEGGLDSNNRTRKHKEFSMGNKVKTSDGNYYCRSWSTRRAYNEYGDLIRNDGLWRENQPGGSKMKSFISLREPGLPKIAWERDDLNEKDIVEALKGNSGYVPSDKVIPYMLSIENLAWKDSPHYFKLPACERGPNGGRLMWFPPYNINFTDNTSVNWDTTTFIGRAEPIYTYNNTERTGTLSFSVIVDHSSLVNNLRDDFSTNLETFFAGCDTETARNILQDAFKEFIPPNTTQNNQEPEPTPQTNLELPDISDDLIFYFKNATNLSTDDPSGCGIEGRCYDDTYERNIYRAIDNANLYTLTAVNDNPVPTNGPAYPYTENTTLGADVTEPPCTGTNPSAPWGFGKTKKEQKNSNFCKKSGPENIVGLKFNDGSVSGTTDEYGVLYSRIGLNESDFYGKELDLECEGCEGLTGIEKMIRFLVTNPKGKGYTIEIRGGTSDAASNEYNEKLAQDRANTIKNYMLEEMKKLEKGGVVKWTEDDDGFDPIELYPEKSEPNGRWDLSKKDSITSGEDRDENFINNEFTQTPFHLHPNDEENPSVISRRRARVLLKKNPSLIQDRIDTKKQEQLNEIFDEQKKKEAAEQEVLREEIVNASKNFINECDYFVKIKNEQPFVYDTLRDKLQNFHPAFHSMTPEGFNSRLTFLQQCGRQGPSFIDPLQPQNTAFGRPPICILRIGDFYHTKIAIDTINFTFDPLQWDLNPEGIGVQPMVCSVDLNFKFIGGSSLQGPIRQLQNAVSYNFFANTSLYMSLDEILAKRGSNGFLVDGNPEQAEAFEKSNKETETFFYGPFGSQEQADDKFTSAQQDTQNRIDKEREELERKRAEEEAKKQEIEEEKKEEIEKANEEGTEENKKQKEQTDNKNKINFPVELTLIVQKNNEINVLGGNNRINVGEVREGDNVSWNLEIQNEKDIPIVVENIGYSSGWVNNGLSLDGNWKTYKSSPPILPKESIKFTWKTKDMPFQQRQDSGAFSKTITIQTTGGSKSFIITGFVEN